jgi:hypothetical protein
MANTLGLEKNMNEGYAVQSLTVLLPKHRNNGTT